MMVTIVVSWRCKCGIRVKVVAEADPSQPPATQIASCPNCGDSQTIEGDKIVSVTEDIFDASPRVDSKQVSEFSVSRCNEKDSLMVAYDNAFEAYAREVSELAEVAGLMAHAEFEFLYNKVQTARQLFVEIRERLSKHKATHGC
jgi:hypothetical protein